MTASPARRVAASRTNRARSAGLLVLVAGCLAASAGAAAERVASRYGEVSAQRSDAGNFVISVNARPVAKLAADAVSLHHVTQQGRSEYVIAELWQPGLNCHRSFVVLAVHAKGKAQSSPVFGRCTELAGVSHAAGGIQIELRGSGLTDASRTVSQRYLFSGGRLTKQRDAPRSPEQ